MLLSFREDFLAHFVQFRQIMPSFVSNHMRLLPWILPERGRRLKRPAAINVGTDRSQLATMAQAMGATHFLLKTLPKVATEMALHVLAYNLTRVMNIVGIKPLLGAILA